MKIIWIEINQETASYYITKAKFKTWWGKEFVSTCISEKGMSATKYFDSGRHIPINLWASFRVFLESNMDYIKNNMDQDIIKITECVEVIDNWGNVETYKNEDLYKLLTTPEDWSDDQTFIGDEDYEGTYYIDDLIGKTVWVGDYVFKVVENK